MEKGATYVDTGVWDGAKSPAPLDDTKTGTHVVDHRSPVRLGARLCALLAAAFVATACVRAAAWRSFRVEEGFAIPSTWVNDRPLIGVLSQSLGPDQLGANVYSPRNSYIAASYIKFVEAGGARAVPILQDMPEEEIRRRFNAVNGVLIPGGSQTLSAGHPYYDATKLLLDMTIEENDNGVVFPLHGTCLGFEALVVAVSGNSSVIRDFDSTDVPAALIPELHIDNSNFFGSMPIEVRRALLTAPYAYENHVHGIAYDDIIDNPDLRDFFKVLTFSLDKQGKGYVSTMEARKYPVTATQWHPEKNAFEWSPMLNIPHDPVATLVTLSVATNFVNHARKNNHAPTSLEEENDMLIYNWAPKFTGREGGTFEQVYVFPPWESL